jgi:uncharacterized membrane protein YdjX (TVP38/TMEM64 family)
MQQQADMVEEGSAQEAPALAQSGDAKGRRAVGRMVLLGVVLIGALTAVYLSPVRPWLLEAYRQAIAGRTAPPAGAPGGVQETLSHLGTWLRPVCIVAVAVLVACGIPRILLCGIGGLVLGFWWALLIVNAGTLLGYYGVFLFTRWGGRDWAMHRWPKLQRWAERIQGQGVMGVILIRQLPIHGSLVNLGLGLSRVKHRHFLIGTSVGLLPEAVPVTLVGAGLAKPSFATTTAYLAIAVAVFALIWIGCSYGLRAMKNSRAGATLMAEAASLEGVGEE